MGRQQHGAAEGSQELDEGDQSIDERDGVHREPVEVQAVISDGEARHLFGALSEGAAGQGVHVKDPLSTDRRQLDDVTHISV